MLRLDQVQQRARGVEGAGRPQRLRISCTESTSTLTLSGSAPPPSRAICTHWKPLKLNFGVNISGCPVPVPSEM